MKAVCHREGLLAACQLASVATAAKEVKPILRNLKVIAEADRCILLATDTEVGVRMEVRSVEVQEPGEAILPTGRIISILRESTDETLTLEASADGCTLTGQFNEFQMPGEDPSLFPDFPTFAEEKYHELTAGVLREMIRRTAFAAADEEHTRFPAMSGILWELEEDRVRLVATDGKRLAVADGPAKAHGGHSTKTQLPSVPAKAMTLLERNLNEPDELVQVSFRPNEVLIKTERAMIYGRLVEGRYPDYRRVIPQKHTLKVPLTVGTFHAAVRQAAIMTDDESKKVVFSLSKRKLTLQAQSSVTGRSRVELAVDYEGKPLEIGLDPKHLKDMLSVLDPDAPLLLELEASDKPALLHTEANDFQYVAMPMGL